MKKKSSFILAIRDGEGYWFSRFDDDGEVFFVSPPEAAKQYDKAAKALSQRDKLAQMCGDDSLTVRQVGPTAAVISRGDLGDEHRIIGARRSGNHLNRRGTNDPYRRHFDQHDIVALRAGHR
jgi:hypothetical protein